MVLSNGFFYERIQLDTINERFNKVPTAKEGDANGRGMIVVLTENGLVKNTTGVSLLFKWEHTRITGAQGLEDFEPLNLTKGEYIVTYPTEMNHEGYVKAEIRIIDNGKYAGSRNMKIQVEPSVGDDTAMGSSNQFSALVTALLQVNSWNTTIDGKIVEWEADMEATKKLYIDTMNDVEATYPQELLSLGSQLEHNDTRDYIYNPNALKKVRAKQFFSTIAIGDSIGTGTAAPGNLGFMQQLGRAFRLLENSFNYDVMHFYNANLTGWVKEETGIGKNLISSSTGAETISIFAFSWHVPKAEYTVKVIYSARADGGTFDVGYDDVVLATINCAGSYNDGLISAEYTIPANKTFKITPSEGQKVYVNGVVIIRDSTQPYYAFDSWVKGGRHASDYTVAELERMLTYNPKDLLIWELFVNDYAAGEYASYVDRTEAVITKAKSLGMDVLITLPCGNSSTPSDPTWSSAWKTYLYDVSKRLDCALIDYDLMFGGFTKAKANGLIADAIHPTSTGHLLMANVLVDLLLGIPNPHQLNVSITTDDSRHVTYGARKDDNSVYYPKLAVFDDVQLKTTDSNGNKKYVPSMPVIGYDIGNVAQLPKVAAKGSMALIGSGIYGFNGTTWTRLYQYVNDEIATSLPTATGSNRGKTVILDSGTGVADKMYTCIKNETGNYVWKQITLV